MSSAALMHLATLTVAAGMVIGMSAYTGSVLGDILSAYLKGLLSGDR